MNPQVSETKQIEELSFREQIEMVKELLTSVRECRGVQSWKCRQAREDFAHVYAFLIGYYSKDKEALLIINGIVKRDGTKQRDIRQV